MDTVAVIDFETTGISPEMGDRATEVAVVIVTDGKIVDHYQSLMNTGAYIPAFIEALTGISNAMVREAPPAAQVMNELAEFVGDIPLVAHNASFDSRFLDAEWLRIGKRRQQTFACSMLLARRIYPNSPNHKLGTLVSHLGLPQAIRAHRALADAEMTAHLWVRMVSDIMNKHGINTAPHEFLCTLQKVPKAKIANCIIRHKLNNQITAQ
ncbi:MAG: 3'-5' exonuclease [Proteobacteria bacterium]|nr:3'-5' exonuclease [Pseudomonadota bacterium]